MICTSESSIGAVSRTNLFAALLSILLSSTGSKNTKLLKVFSVAILKREEVDPDSVSKDSRFSEDFRVEMHFKGCCDRGCRPERPLKDLCPRCKQEMDSDIQESWVHIYNILEAHKFPTHAEGVMVNFNASCSDYQSILTKAKELQPAAEGKSKSHSPGQR